MPAFRPPLALARLSMAGALCVRRGRETTTTVHRYRWDWNRQLHRDQCESEFEHRVADCLEEFVEQHGGAKRLRLFNQVQASGKLGVSSCGQKRLDFVLLNGSNGTCVAVEVDGRDHFTEGGRAYSEAHLERVEVLRRAGWKIVHVPYYRWWRNGWLSDRGDPQFQNSVQQLFADLKLCLGIPSLGEWLSVVHQGGTFSTLAEFSRSINGTLIFTGGFCFRCCSGF